MTAATKQLSPLAGTNPSATPAAPPEAVAYVSASVPPFPSSPPPFAPKPDAFVVKVMCFVDASGTEVIQS